MKKGLAIKIVSLVGLALMSGVTTPVMAASSANQTSSPNKIVAVGSTALQPLVEDAAKGFQKSHSNVDITVQGGGSGTGLSQVDQGAVTIGNSDIFAESSKGINAKKLTDHQVAVVGMAPVVNKTAGVKNVTMKQLRDIFTGKITNWKKVGGSDQPIVVVNRAEGSGTRATFEASVLKGAKAVKAQEQDTNGTVQQIVKSTPGAVSYLAFSYFEKGITPLSIDKVKPTAKNVTTNNWKIWSYEHMYTQKKYSDNTKEFIKYIKSDKFQSTKAKKLGYISINEMKVSKNAKNVVSKK